MNPLTNLVVATAFILAFASVGHGADPLQTDPSKTAASEVTVTGDVQLIEGEFYFIRDTSGHEVRLHVNSGTKLGERFKVGDKIEARVTSEGHATSITLQIPKNGTAPPLPNTNSTSPLRSPDATVAQ